MKGISQEERDFIRNWILQTSIFVLFYSPFLLFLAADWFWIEGLVYVLILTLFLALHPILLIPINPSLLAERARGTKTAGTKRWDRILTMIGPGLLPFISQFLCAVDHRYQWSEVWFSGQIVGFACVSLGYALFLWAMVENGFFAEGVRIQSERGHVVCSTGPYRFVRHPGYFGSILSVIGTPLILDSRWGMIPAVLSVLVIVLRTILEDKTLQAELEGYADYAQIVHYRLIPGLF